MPPNVTDGIVTSDAGSESAIGTFNDTNSAAWSAAEVLSHAERAFKYASAAGWIGPMQQAFVAVSFGVMLTVIFIRCEERAHLGKRALQGQQRMHDSERDADEEGERLTCCLADFDQLCFRTCCRWFRCVEFDHEPSREMQTSCTPPRATPPPPPSHTRSVKSAPPILSAPSTRQVPEQFRRREGHGRAYARFRRRLVGRLH